MPFNNGAKWWSERLKAFASELEDRVNAAAQKDDDGETHYYLARALDFIMEADDELMNSGELFS